MRDKLALLSVAPDISLYHIGPPLDLGPLPSFFYLALSGADSLTLDPFNQPIKALHGQMIRCFSLDLPAHENNLSPHDAIQTWADDFAKGRNPLGEFFEKMMRAIEFVIEQRFADPKHLAIGGLSRGGLLACHVAAKEERIGNVLLFAPVTKLGLTKEFAKDPGSIEAFDAIHLAEPLSKKRIRIYIGNNDTRVDTRASFEFAMEVVAKAERRADVEFVMSPSIGHMGHGTSPEVFKAGADWIKDMIGRR